MTPDGAVHYDPTGCVESIVALPPHPPIFHVPPCEDADFTALVLKQLEAWIRDHGDLYGIPDGTAPATLALDPAQTPIYVNERVTVIRFPQTYRGRPIHGRSAALTLALFDRTEVRRISGRPIDQTCRYAGLDAAISQGEATAAIQRHWERLFPGSVLVGNVHQIAIPGRSMIGYIGEISEPIFTSSRVIRASVVVDARTGELVDYDDRKALASVRGFEMTSDPRTDDQVDFDGVPATQFGSTIHFDDIGLPCDPPSWRDFRMGTDTRLSVLDYNGGDGIGDVDNITVGACSSGSPPPAFDSSTGSRLLAQDLYVKTVRALDAVDPIMGELFSHPTHAYSWHHHPDVPEIAHRSPLVIVVNPSSIFLGGLPGRYLAVWVSEVDLEALALPVPHPLVEVCRDAAGEPVSCSSADIDAREYYLNFVAVSASPPSHTHVLFHELGHYYDAFNTHGLLVMELREIVGQLFSLYLHRKLYPALPYTLSTSEDIVCALTNLLSGLEGGIVVHPDCIDDIGEVSQEIGTPNSPYRIPSFTQAYWSLLFGISNAIEDGQLVTAVPDSLPDAYEDRWMEALLFALQMGNEQTYVELWENMELFVQANYPGEVPLIHAARDLHGL